MADGIVASEKLTGIIDLLPEPQRGIGWTLGGMQVLFQREAGRLFIKRFYPEREYEIQDKHLRDDVYFLVNSLSEEVKRQREMLNEGIESALDSAEEIDKETSLLRSENEKLRSFIDQRCEVEKGSKEEVQAQVEALKAARAADKAGFEVVIRELREEVARLKGNTARTLDVIKNYESRIRGAK